MHASDEPVVEVPAASRALGACHRSARMRQQCSSTAAVDGYSSLSIMFLSNVSAYSRSAESSIHVVTKVARFRRAFPSRRASSCTMRYAASADSGSAPSRLRASARSAIR